MDFYIADLIISTENGSRVSWAISGQNLTVKSKSKIISWIIYDGVYIGGDCNITNCESTKIGNNCTLTDYVIARNYFVPNDTNKCGKIISKDNDDNFDF